MPARVRMALLHPETLKKWSPYSLKDRVELCRKRFRFPVTYYQLRNLYKKFGVKYLRTEWIYRNAVIKAEHYDEQRRKYAQVLARIIAQNKGPIYLDESS